MAASPEFDALKASLEFYIRYLDEHIEHTREMVDSALDSSDPGMSVFTRLDSDALASAAVAQSSLEEMVRVADTLRVIISEAENASEIYLD